MLYHSVCKSCPDELVSREETAARVHYANHAAAGHRASFAQYATTELDSGSEADAAPAPERTGDPVR